MIGIIGTETVINTARSRIDRLLDYPKRGVPVGGGYHVPIADTYDPQSSAGWTVTHMRPTLDVAVNGKFALVLDDIGGVIASALADPVARSRITKAQATALENMLLNTVTLGPEWFPSEELV